MIHATPFELCRVWDRCGGCPRIGLDTDAQRRGHVERLHSVLSDCGLPPLPVRWLPSPARVGYRNRIRLALIDGRPRFFNETKDPSCAVLAQGLKEALARFRSWAAQHRDLLRGFDHVELRGPDSLGHPAVTFVSASAKAAVVGGPRDFLSWVRGRGRPPVQRHAITCETFVYVPLGAFVQVNSEVNAKLVAAMRDEIANLGARSFADLYAGSGNFGLPLLRAGLSGSGVEKNTDSIGALKRAAEEQGLDANGFSAGDAEQWLGQALRERRRYDVVVADPPRAGLRELAPGVATLARRDLVLLSCKLASFRRDVSALLESGCRLRTLWAADMFPNTEHVEIVAWLRAPPSVPDPI